MSPKWTLGKVVSVVRSKDGMVRRATIEYQNSTDDFVRTTDRAVRSLIKIWYIDDNGWQEDISRLEKLIDAIKKVILMILKLAIVLVLKRLILNHLKSLVMKLLMSIL